MLSIKACYVDSRMITTMTVTMINCDSNLLNFTVMVSDSKKHAALMKIK